MNSSSDTSEVDIADLIREVDRDAFRPIFPLTGGATTMAANRLLLPGQGSAAAELRSFIQAHGIDHPVLRSHAISPDTASAILNGEIEHAISSRDEAFEGLIDELGDRLAEWGRTDRPSLEYLLAQAAAE